MGRQGSGIVVLKLLLSLKNKASDMKIPRNTRFPMDHNVWERWKHYHQIPTGHSIQDFFFVMDRSVLNKVTSADYDPVPGFSLTSICGMIKTLVLGSIVRYDPRWTSGVQTIGRIPNLEACKRSCWREIQSFEDNQIFV
jgi:hypothetical protein